MELSSTPKSSVCFCFEEDIGVSSLSFKGSLSLGVKSVVIIATDGILVFLGRFCFIQACKVMGSETGSPSILTSS